MANRSIQNNTIAFDAMIYIYNELANTLKFETINYVNKYKSAPKSMRSTLK